MPLSLEASMRSSQSRAAERRQRPASLPDLTTGHSLNGAPATIRFRRFCLVPGARQLLRDGQPVDLGDRAFDLLAVLLSARGIILSKNELIDYVWPSTTVDESNLRFQMAVLRKVLGEDRDVIKTVTGRGYLFTAEIDAESAGGASPLLPANLRILDAFHRASLHVPVARERPHRSVIVVDDDRGLCEGLQGFFQSVGLQVELFGSVGEFLARFNGSSAA